MTTRTLSARVHFLLMPHPPPVPCLSQKTNTCWLLPRGTGLLSQKPVDIISIERRFTSACSQFTELDLFLDHSFVILKGIINMWASSESLLLFFYLYSPMENTRMILPLNPQGLAWCLAYSMCLVSICQVGDVVPCAEHMLDRSILASEGVLLAHPTLQSVLFSFPW